MSAFLTAVSDIFTTAIGMVGTVGSTVADQPILLCFAALPLCGIGISFFKRLVRID